MEVCAIARACRCESLKLQLQSKWSETWWTALLQAFYSISHHIPSCITLMRRFDATRNYDRQTIFNGCIRRLKHQDLSWATSVRILMAPNPRTSYYTWAFVRFTMFFNGCRVLRKMCSLLHSTPILISRFYGLLVFSAWAFLTNLRYHLQYSWSDSNPKFW
jgi:hypothetical protein